MREGAKKIKISIFLPSGELLWGVAFTVRSFEYNSKSDRMITFTTEADVERTVMLGTNWTVVIESEF